jgi:hypothetical protein
MSRTAVFAAPVLCRGYHVHPRKGANLVEFAGALPGGRWSDDPAGVQPVLAALARVVNDATTDRARMALLPWAAWLVGTAGPVRDDLLDRAVAARVGATALRHCDRSGAAVLAPVMAELAWHEPAATGRLRRWWATAGRRRAAAKLIRASALAVAAAGRHPDETLRTMLAEAVNTVRAHDGLAPVTVDVTGHLSWPAVQPIRVEIRIPDGAESRYEFCTALPGTWPAALATAWSARGEKLRWSGADRREGGPAG